MNMDPVRRFLAANVAVVTAIAFGAGVSGCTEVDTDTETETETEAQAETQTETGTGTGTGTGTQAAAETRNVTVMASNFAFEPATISAKPGQTLKIKLVNEGSVSHNLHIDGMDAKTETIQTGNSDTLTLTVPKDRDSIRFYCKVPGHEQAGMVGEIVIEG